MQTLDSNNARHEKPPTKQYTVFYTGTVQMQSEPMVLEDGNQETVNGPSRVTVLVRWSVSKCQRVNRRTRLRQRNCRESVSSEFGDSEWVCRRSWALKSYDSAER
jgi:hypothetical protein